MTSTPSNVIPLVVQFGGETVFSGQLSLQTLLAAAAAANVLPSTYKSYPLTPDQAQQLLRKVDPKTVDFLRILAQNEGEATFGQMQKIFGIKEWPDFSSRFGKGLTRALRHLTDNSSASLIWWLDDEWKSDNDPEGPVYIDGPALKSIRAAIGLGTI